MTAWETAWWIRWPGRLEFELEQLEAAGYRVVSKDRSTGLVVLRLRAPEEKTGVGELELTVTFPDVYPSTAPEVIADDLGMVHHQHPFGGTLCLIGRSSTYWHSQCHLAELLNQQLRKAIVAGRSPEAGDAELDQAEPFASYYTYTPGMEFLLDGDATSVSPRSAGEAGFLLCGPVPPREPAQRAIGLVQFMLHAGSEVYRASSAVAGLFPEGEPRIKGRWVVLETPVRTDDPAELWRVAAEADPEGVAITNQGGESMQLRAVGFPDERTRATKGIDWLVLIRKLGQERRDRTAGRSGNPARRAQRQRTPDSFHLVRVDGVSRADLTARSPLTAFVGDRSVVIIGCGAIGSVVAEQLARTGVRRFALVDRDVLEPGNLTRHAATMHHTGLNKAVAMAGHLRTVNPHVEADVLAAPVAGVTRSADGKLITELLAELITGADLVIDSSAEVGVQEATAAMARVLGVPWLMLSASEGAAGGTVVLVEPGGPWCFSCFQWHRVDGTIPFPPEVAGPRVQPVGCAEPTFAGAGFDLAEVSLHAARTAVGRLLRGIPDAYPEDGHDAWILSLRGDDGARTGPKCDGFTVSTHPSCAAHAGAA